MSDLLWFDGVTWDTPIGNIGWTWVIIVVLLGILVKLGLDMWRLLK